MGFLVLLRRFTFSVYQQCGRSSEDVSIAHVGVLLMGPALCFARTKYPHSSEIRRLSDVDLLVPRWFNRTELKWRRTVCGFVDASLINRRLSWVVGVEQTDVESRH